MSRGEALVLSGIGLLRVLRLLLAPLASHFTPSAPRTTPQDHNGKVGKVGTLVRDCTIDNRANNKQKSGPQVAGLPTTRDGPDRRDKSWLPILHQYSILYGHREVRPPDILRG
jgi:hypothetical protein